MKRDKSMKKTKNRKIIQILMVVLFLFIILFLGISEIKADEIEGIGKENLESVTEISQGQTSDSLNLISQEQYVSGMDLASGMNGTSPWRVDSQGVFHVGSGALLGALDPIISKNQINKIILEGPVIAPINSTYLFENFKNVTEIENLVYLNTSDVINMSGMFYGMSKLSRLDVSQFDTSKVKSMSYMFYSTSSLTSLDLSNFDTSKVMNMLHMFAKMYEVTSLNVSNFDTSKVIYMNYMFHSLNSLTTLDLSHFNTSNVTLMPSMFNGLSSLSSLNISSFDTSKVTNMSNMFHSATSLSSLDISSFDTSKVTDMSAMFNNTSSLTRLNVSQFNTSNVTNMSHMFAGTTSLLSLDVSNFNTSNVDNMSYMFSDMPNVGEIDLSGLTEVNEYNLFTQMPKLTSLNLNKLRKITTMNFLNNNNEYPTYVDLSNLTILEDEYSIGSKTGVNPVYIKVGNSRPSNLNNESTNAIFYQNIDPNLNYEVEKGNKITISSIGENSLLSYNMADCKVIWYIDGQLSQYVGTEINVNSESLTKGMHTFRPVISYKGKEEKSFFDGINVNVKVKVKKLTAEAVPQEISLGSRILNSDYSNYVKNVKFGDQSLTKNEYTITVHNSAPTDTIGDKVAQVRIDYDKEYKTLLLDVPVKVVWGNTIGSNNIIYATSTGFSLSLLTEKNPNIVATLGDGKNKTNWINDYRSGTYITTKLYKDSQLLNSENTNPYIDLAISGRDSANSAMNKWGNLKNKNGISYGDVLQYDVLTNWGDNKWVMRDENQKFESLGKQSIYYEITREGYRTLYLNQLVTKTANVPIYSTKDYLDAHINDYIDLKGYSNISVKEFSQYPNTNASGQQKGKIVVEEMLKTGKNVQYEYEVTFIIGEGELTYKVPEILTFKEFSKEKSEQIIPRMNPGNLGISVKDNRGEGKQGNWRLMAQVKQTEELMDYLVFRDSSSQDKYLNQGATEIYFQKKQNNPKEPLEVEVSGEWSKNNGILLKVPSKNNLSSKQYTSTIIWNLVEGP